jgi:hypothetical protein
MKRGPKQSALTLLLAGAAWTVLAHEFEFDAIVQASEQQEGDEEANGEDEHGSSASTQERSSGGKAAQVRRLVSRLTRLHKWMGEKLELDASQERAIHGLFQEHMDDLRSGVGGGNSRDDTRDREKRLEELQQEMSDAREQRDREAVIEIRNEMRNLLRERQTQLTARTSAFLVRVEDELADDQLTEFRNMVARLGLTPDAPTKESMQDMLRAVLSTEVGLSAERREVIMDILRSSFLTMDPGEQAEDQMSTVGRDLRAEIIGELTEDQWAKVEAYLKKNSSQPSPTDEREDDPDGIPDE